MCSASVCINCKNLTNKYKCPKCIEPYCSLPCYKEHLSSGCALKIEQSANNCNNEFEDTEPTAHEPFNTEDTVPRHKLEQLKECEGLCNLLRNPNLRELLAQIDVSRNASAAMRAAMQEPLFVEFADECLRVIEPASDDERE